MSTFGDMTCGLWLIPTSLQETTSLDVKRSPYVPLVFVDWIYVNLVCVNLAYVDLVCVDLIYVHIPDRDLVQKCNRHMYDVWQPPMSVQKVSNDLHFLEFWIFLENP